MVTADDSSAVYDRWGMPASGPLTVEVRVRVESGEATLLLQDASYSTWVYMLPNELQILFYPDQLSTYPVDLSQFQAVRVGTDTQGDASVWVDNVLLCSGKVPGGNPQEPGVVAFGAPYGSASSSYWDYVAYSAAFLPVPEPSCITALAAGLVGLGGLAVGRRRRG